MPVRNGASYVRISVLSTLFALPKSAELIVVDDGSSDGTLDVLSDITDNRLKVISSVPIGIAGALNLGISQARGEYIGRMDSDDICLPWRFNFQLQYLKRYPSVDFVFTTAIAFGLPLSPLFILPQLPWRLSPEKFKQVLGFRNPAVHPTLLAKKEALEKVGGYKNLGIEDEELWLRATLKGRKLTRLAMPTILLRLHKNQTTRQKDWQRSSSQQVEVMQLREKLSEELESVSDQLSKFESKILDVLDQHGCSGFRILLRRANKNLHF
jgi:hypothetical protein